MDWTHNGLQQNAGYSKNAGPVSKVSTLLIVNGLKTSETHIKANDNANSVTCE